MIFLELKLTPGLPMPTLIKVETSFIKSLQTRLILCLLIYFVANSCIAEEIFVQTPISLDQATKQIIKNDSNLRVLGADTEIIECKLVHVIKVLTPDGRILHYKIDAETSELITNR
jgi:uncharacterized membrane protein YkoI